MSIISKKMGKNNFVYRYFYFVLGALLASCGFDGPWSFYPEKRDVYTGIYTYGYIIEGESPYICFSKVYQLDESSAENFAFYDSAYVTVTGEFESNGLLLKNEAKILTPEEGKPNCFIHDDIKGIGGNTYTMRAFFKWDSAGHQVETEYTAEAKIPTGFDLNGVNVPLAGGKYKWVDVDIEKYKDKKLEVNFLEYPDDVNLYKFSMKYNDDIGGVLVYNEYDIVNGGENVNTTVNYMVSGFLKKDSLGYMGISVRNGIESHANMGYEENRQTAGINLLDTIYIPNMTLSLGVNNLYFLATDKAYMKYRRYVLGAIDDPRIIPESNIENGMGVFSGMTKLKLSINMLGDGVAYWYIAVKKCENTDNDENNSWDSRTCRLYQDVFCAGLKDDFEGTEGELYELNKNAYNYYVSGTEELKIDFCYAPAIKAAMMNEMSSWSAYLPKDIDANAKKEAYSDALKRYCIASNFKNIEIANCSEMKKQCLENEEKNTCKIYLWQWCADRNWDMESYPQCKDGFVSRYYLEELNSSILKREVDKICDKRVVGTIKQCERE